MAPNKFAQKTMIIDIQLKSFIFHICYTIYYQFYCVSYQSLPTTKKKNFPKEIRISFYQTTGKCQRFRFQHLLYNILSNQMYNQYVNTKKKIFSLKKLALSFIKSQANLSTLFKSSTAQNLSFSTFVTQYTINSNV